MARGEGGDGRGRGSARESDSAAPALTTPAAAVGGLDADPDAALAASVGAVSRYATVNGVRLHYVEAGSGPLLLFLHGFPNFWYLWRRQIPSLAAAGYRVVAPDLRGYNLSGKPRDVRAYRVHEVARDVAALARGLGALTTTLVGHDWGGVVGWHLGRTRPDLVTRLVVVNAPHPTALARELRRPDQLARSAYVGFFQLPRVPERVLRARDFRVVERVLRRDPSKPGAFSDEDVARHKAALARPGALTAMLDYYRALPAALREVRRAARVPVVSPTLVLWGERDRYLSNRLLDGLGRWVPDLTVHRYPAATHWVVAEEPDDVSDRIAAFARGR